MTTVSELRNFAMSATPQHVSSPVQKCTEKGKILDWFGDAPDSQTRVWRQRTYASFAASSITLLLGSAFDLKGGQLARVAIFTIPFIVSLAYFKSEYTENKVCEKKINDLKTALKNEGFPKAVSEKARNCFEKLLEAKKSWAASRMANRLNIIPVALGTFISVFSTHLEGTPHQTTIKVLGHCMLFLGVLASVREPYEWKNREVADLSIKFLDETKINHCRIRCYVSRVFSYIRNLFFSVSSDAKKQIT